MLPMRLFWSTPIHLLLLAGPVLLAWRLAPRPSRAGNGARRRALARRSPASGSGEGPRPVRSTLPDGRSAGGRRAWDASARACSGTPSGSPRSGRILIEDNRWTGDSIWDRTRNDKRWQRTRTNKPYDTEWYGELSGYNYYCITEYARHFFPEVTP